MEEENILTLNLFEMFDLDITFHFVQQNKKKKRKKLEMSHVKGI